MLGVSRLMNGTVEAADALRYGRRAGSGPAHLLHYSADKKPVVIWNYTRRCNLSCIHCYADSHDRDYPGELTTAEGRSLLDDLAVSLRAAGIRRHRSVAGSRGNAGESTLRCRVPSGRPGLVLPLQPLAAFRDEPRAGKEDRDGAENRRARQGGR